MGNYYPPIHQGDLYEHFWQLYSVDKCWVLWENWRLCFRRVNVGLVESWGWWKSLNTYCFFAQYNVPEHVCLLQAMKWQSKIHDMLQSIPSISPNALSVNFDSINSKISIYEIFRDTLLLLELAIWKSTVTMLYDGNTNLLTASMKLECRNCSSVMLASLFQMFCPS